MPQMTPSAARVIDPILTNVARGYQNNELIGMSLFPEVPVGQRAGKILKFGKEAFMIYDTARAPGANVRRMQIGYGDDAYAIVDHSLGGVVPIELLEEADAVPGINLGTATVNTVMASLRLRLEVQQASLATAAGQYGANNKVTLAGTSQWSDSANSDPIVDIETAKEAIRAATGKKANVVVMGPSVWSKLKLNAKIIERMKYTGRDVPTQAIVAALFDIDQVLVGEAIQADAAGTFSDVWGKFVVVAYTERSGLADMGRPTYGYTYQLRGYPYVEPARWDADSRSWLYDTSDALQPVIAGADAGYLISAAVA